MNSSNINVKHTVSISAITDKRSFIIICNEIAILDKYVTLKERKFKKTDKIYFFTSSPIGQFFILCRNINLDYYMIYNCVFANSPNLLK